MTTICDEIKLALNEVIEYESENLIKAVNQYCYLIAKDINNAGCVALKVTHGRELTEFKRMLAKEFSCNNIEFITISRPYAYKEYEPYKFVNSKEDFIHAVHTKLNDTPNLVYCSTVAEKILDAAKTPLSECISEEEVEW